MELEVLEDVEGLEVQVNLFIIIENLIGGHGGSPFHWTETHSRRV